MNKMNRRTLLKSSALGLVAVSFGAQAASHAGKEHLVEIRNFAFHPAALTVSPGDTIKWTNMDGAPHTATADDNSWTTGTLRKNQSGVLAVTNGIAKTYHCRFHPNMKAALTISMG